LTLPGWRGASYANSCCDRSLLLPKLQETPHSQYRHDAPLLSRNHLSGITTTLCSTSMLTSTREIHVYGSLGRKLWSNRAEFTKSHFPASCVQPTRQHPQPIHTSSQAIVMYRSRTAGITRMVSTPRRCRTQRACCRVT
jgi:hypothetical protein